MVVDSSGDYAKEITKEKDTKSSYAINPGYQASKVNFYMYWNYIDP